MGAGRAGGAARGLRCAGASDAGALDAGAPDAGCAAALTAEDGTHHGLRRSECREQWCVRLGRGRAAALRRALGHVQPREEALRAAGRAAPVEARHRDGEGEREGHRPRRGLGECGQQPVGRGSAGAGPCAARARTPGTRRAWDGLGWTQGYERSAMRHQGAANYGRLDGSVVMYKPTDIKCERDMCWWSPLGDAHRRWND